jgi:hypothetical protein
LPCPGCAEPPRSAAAKETNERELELKAGGPIKGYVMKGQEIVGLKAKLNLTYMKLPFCSVYPFRCSEITFEEMSATNIYYCAAF